MRADDNNYRPEERSNAARQPDEVPHNNAAGTQTPSGNSGGTHSRASRIILALLAAAVIILVVWGISAIAGSFAVVKSIKICDANENSPYTDTQVAQAIGVSVGMKKKNIDTSQAERELLEKLSFAEKARVRKRMGGEVEITLWCTEAKYAAAIAGEQFLLSDNLRVLGKTDAFGGALPLELPRVMRALVGQEILFFEDAQFITQTLDTIYSSALGDKLDSVDMSNRYSVKFLYADRFTVCLGDTSDISAKLETAARLIASDELANAVQATIDVSDLRRPTVRQTSN